MQWAAKRRLILIKYLVNIAIEICSLCARNILSDKYEWKCSNYNFLRSIRYGSLLSNSQCSKSQEGFCWSKWLKWTYPEYRMHVVSVKNDPEKIIWSKQTGLFWVFYWIYVEATIQKWSRSFYFSNFLLSYSDTFDIE